MSKFEIKTEFKGIWGTYTLDHILTSCNFHYELSASLAKHVKDAHAEIDRLRGAYQSLINLNKANTGEFSELLSKYNELKASTATDWQPIESMEQVEGLPYGHYLLRNGSGFVFSAVKGCNPDSNDKPLFDWVSVSITGLANNEYTAENLKELGFTGWRYAIGDLLGEVSK